MALRALGLQATRLNQGAFALGKFGRLNSALYALADNKSALKGSILVWSFFSDSFCYWKHKGSPAYMRLNGKSTDGELKFFILLNQ